ncbi:hypothetical protein TNCV_4807961 [Trichonephila clavipes]|nr:hypothetical protein TNCV_4807961 [Trichonephila clavipes]
MHCSPTRRVFSGTGLELMTCLMWSNTLTTGVPQPPLQLTSDIFERVRQSFVRRCRLCSDLLGCRTIPVIVTRRFISDVDL